MSARYEITDTNGLRIDGIPWRERGLLVQYGAIRQQSADLDKLRAELAAVVGERDRLRDAMADKIAHESYITGLTAGPGGLVMGMEGDGPRLLSAAFVAMYRDCGAVNYLEMTIQDPANGERFAVTVQRVEGKTPNQLRRDAEAERDHLRARLAAIDAAPTVAWQDVHAPQDLYHGRPQQVDVRPLIARPAKD